LIFIGQPPPAAAEDGTDVPPKRILLVDDYPDALEIWGLYLRALGFDVVTAEDGLTALEKAHAYNPDIIVLDLELPGISGYEAAIRLRNDDETKRIPLIAATGYSHVKQLDQARRAGFDSIVIKPCEPAALVAEIERLLAPDARPSATVPVKRFSQNG
jgi:CheY-like chemotaxis protein